MIKQETDLEALGREIVQESAFLDRTREVLSTTIIGQKRVIDRVLIALLANGHLLLEGVPGLAKTLIVRTFATARLLATPETALAVMPVNWTAGCEPKLGPAIWA